MKMFHIKRLEKLANFLDSLPEEKFTMGFYADPDESCGIVACVAGWAGLIPDFQKAGLITDVVAGRVRLKMKEPFCYMEGAGAAAYFFGLDEHEKSNLFYPHGFYKHGETPTPHMAAEYIRGIISKHLAEKKPKAK